MKRLFNALAIIANIAIVVGLVKDTYGRLATKREISETNLEDDEQIWENRRAGYHCPGRALLHVEGHQEIPGDAEEKDQ